MTTRKSAGGKPGAKKLKVNRKTLKDLDPKATKKVVGGLARTGEVGMGAGTTGCGKKSPTHFCTAFTYCQCTAMTYCFQITCVKS